MAADVTMVALLLLVGGSLSSDMRERSHERSTCTGDVAPLLARLKDLQLRSPSCGTNAMLLRGGGKGRSKARHLGRSKEGVRGRLNKHTFPHLKRGSDHISAQLALREDNVTKLDDTMQDDSDPELDERKFYAKPISTYDDPSFESVSSVEAKENHRRIFKWAKSTGEELPPKGIVPLTYMGSKKFGVIQVSQTYMGKPLKIYRRSRDPRDGIIWGWGANYDGQLGIANGCKIDR